MYDSDLVRWLTLDPKAEAYYLTSPYVFCVNNPLRFTDTDGRSIRDILWGVFIGSITNLKGDNSLREEYIPDNADHYNSTLRAADVGAFALGATSLLGGGAEIFGGVSAGVLGTLGTAGAAASLAIPAGAAISAHGAALMGTGMMLMKNAGSNLGKAYNYKGPEPNQGGGKLHGGTDHNNAIDKKIQELSKQDNIQNIRKNQQQVDANGNRMGNNRPDIQRDLDGIHHNLEVDRNVRNNVKHERVIRKNDPEAIYEKEILH